ncbi:MAG: DegT/DnrJ/EryC1/StrS family aminotransferase [Chloroflexota bacterium]|nr:DegT/DnrJ/EryC1/StrS family aminotransferase [Chloroflexota bacterium]
MGALRGTLPVTESVAQRTIALPFHNNLSAEQVEYVCDTLIGTRVRIGTQINAEKR